jgi:adenine deaminase
VTRPAVSLRALATARGDAPVDLLLTGGRVLSPGTREWIETDLAVTDGVVVGWGRRDALEVVDVAGSALTPGLIDAHMHLESTKLWVDEFVRAVLPWGTTAVAADPHEIANVFGVRGVEALAEAAARLPFTFGICASSCVPASPFESPGAEVGPDELSALLAGGAIGVAEVMNFPGVIAGDADLRAKIAAAGHRRVDGHAPGLGGRRLDAYLAAGVESDHECTTLAEAEEKRRKGMWVFIRQGSASQNLAELIPTVLAHGTDLVAFCTDDREPDTLAEVGHVNDCVRLAVAAGVGEIDALVMATANPAAYHGFAALGALAPGYQADICAFSELGSWRPDQVWQRGRLVAAGGAAVAGAVPSQPVPAWMLTSVHLEQPPGEEAFASLVAVPGRSSRVIGVTAGSLTTASTTADPTDPASGVARLAVVERHRRTGRVGLGWVHGFGLADGALASTVGHDAHNCMVVGGAGAAGPADMAVAVARLAELGGGQVVVRGGRVQAEVALPVGGLMSTRPSAEVAAGLDHLVRIAAGIGVTLAAPFMQLSFLGLSVLPELRLTDRGLVDVGRFELVPTQVD